MASIKGRGISHEELDSMKLFLDGSRRMRRVISLLKQEYPEAHCSLSFETPFQLLVATILSAQCTDERVNQVTPALFKKFPDAHAMAQAKQGELEKLVKSTGFYKNKARSLLETSRSLCKKFQGRIPKTVEELISLRGVGKKTANVVLGNAFQIQSGVVVDTHVGRIARRMGFTTHQDPEKVEEDLKKLIPKKEWVPFSHWMISHGRAVCTARKAYCSQCVLSRYCPRIGVQPE